MWKKAFVALLSANLMVIVLAALWWGSLPKASHVQPKVETASEPGTPATVQLAVGEDAINAYLEYALTEQPDLQKVLSYARVNFDATWEIQFGVKLSDRVIPSDIVFQPIIRDGNLSLKFQSANMGLLPLPISAFGLLKHVPWPSWITVDANEETLNLNFSDRPQHPYGVQVLNYSPDTKLLTLRVTIIPKSLLAH